MTHKRKRERENSGLAFQQFMMDTLLMLPGMLLWLAELTAGIVMVVAITVFTLVILPELAGLLLFS